MRLHIHCQHINKNYMKQLHILVLALAFAQAGMAQTHEELVIDGGFGDNTPSTIVDCTQNEPEIIRQGKGILN